jgi:membrane-associated protease RseP (regulator of RpoE activity)
VSSYPPPKPTAPFPESRLPGPAVLEDWRTRPASQGWREWALPAILFLATLLSTTYAGLFYSDGEPGILRTVISHPAHLLQGVPFSFTLIVILLAHELGHYFACRHYGIRCTPPFFIPLPVTFAGTMGAFIRIKSPFQHRRALFDVGIAGPLAGFAFVVPALVIGIQRSTLVLKDSVPGSIYFGEPLLFRWLGAMLIGYAPGTYDLYPHPIAMAAWFGLLVTSLNLFPIWQLDGGHVAYAILGRERQKKVSLAAAFALMLISLAGWPIPSYLLFASLLLFLSVRSRFYHPPTVSDGEPIGPGRVALGIILFLILIVSFTPVPVSIPQ